MDSKRKMLPNDNELDARELQECVLQILRHGDPYKLTESKVRKLAADETGFDLTDPANRRIVKLTVEDYFMNRQGDDKSREEKVASAKTVEVAAKRPSTNSKSRRKLVNFDDDEEEEAELEARDMSITKMRGSDDDQLEVARGSEEEDDGRMRSNRVTKKKRRGDSDDDEKADIRVNGRRHPVQGAAKRQHRRSDDDESDEEAEVVRGPRARAPEVKKSNVNPDCACKLSKNRTVSVRTFNGKVLISIREYYEKDGKLLPTKKGISLTVEQWEAFKKGIPSIEAAIEQLT